MANVSRGSPAVPSQVLIYTDGSSENVVQAVLAEVRGAIQQVSSKPSTCSPRSP